MTRTSRRTTSPLPRPRRELGRFDAPSEEVASPEGTDAVDDFRAGAANLVRLTTPARGPSPRAEVRRPGTRRFFLPWGTPPHAINECVVFGRPNTALRECDALDPWRTAGGGGWQWPDEGRCASPGGIPWKHRADFLVQRGIKFGQFAVGLRQPGFRVFHLQENPPAHRFGGPGNW